MKHSRCNADMILFACVACILSLALAPSANAIQLSTATRTLPAAYAPGYPSPVQIVALPANSISSWTLVETLPVGWTASAINLAGDWDATDHQITWGPFLGATSHTLTYQAIPPLGANGAKLFSGLVTFNTSSQAVAGNTSISNDQIAPHVVSVTRLDANPTSLSTVRFQVAFSEPVTGVDPSQFSMIRGGTIGGASVTAVANGPTTWTVSEHAITGNGTLGLGVTSNGVSGISDLAGNLLDAPFTSGELYTIDRMPPITVLRTTLINNATRITTTAVEVTFNKPVTGFDSSDIVTTHALVTDFGASTPARYYFTLVSMGEGPFQVGIAAGAARDAAGNPSFAADRLNLAYDVTPPTFSTPIATPNQAKFNTTVVLAFNASEALGDAPVVSVNSHPATIQSQIGRAYSYSYAIKGGDPDGMARIDISGADLAGNSSATSNTTALLVDTTPPVGTIAIAAGAPYTTSTAVTLNMTANDFGGSGASQVNVSSDGSTWNGWVPYVTPLPWMLGAGDGLKSIYVQIQDAAGNISSVTSDTIVLDTVPPVFSNFTASPALATTLATVVTTTFTASEMLQSSPTLSINGHGATLRHHRGMLYGFSYAIAAGDPDGHATLTAAGRDLAGNPAATSTTMVLLVDKTAPTGTVAINAGAATATTTTVYLTLTANDGLGAGVSQMCFSSDGSHWTPWEPYLAYRVWSLSGADGPKVVFVRLQDRAGHIKGGISGTILLDTTAPQSKVTAPTGVSNSALLTLQWSATDPGAKPSGLKHVEIMWLKDSGAWTSLGTFAPGITSTPFDTATHGGPGTYLFFSIATDLAGNVESWPAGADASVRIAAPNVSSVVLYLLGYTNDRTGLDYNRDGAITITDELFRLQAAKSFK